MHIFYSKAAACYKQKLPKSDKVSFSRKNRIFLQKDWTYLQKNRVNVRKIDFFWEKLSSSEKTEFMWEKLGFFVRWTWFFQKSQDLLLKCHHFRKPKFSPILFYEPNFAVTRRFPIIQINRDFTAAPTNRTELTGTLSFSEKPELSAKLTFSENQLFQKTNFFIKSEVFRKAKFSRNAWFCSNNLSTEGALSQRWLILSIIIIIITFVTYWDWAVQRLIE